MGKSSNADTQNYFRDVVYQSHYIDPEYPNISQFNGERAWLNDETPFDQLIWALTAPLTEEDANPLPITQTTYNSAKEWDTRAFTGSSYGAAARAFNDYAVEHYFGDGLPLVVPTPELVEEMLAGTTRDRNEVLGMLKMRGGIITVEKIAINAVMAGAKPEYLPVIIAAMEAYAAGWEFDKMWYHPMTSGGAFNLAIILSGPISKELGLHENTGYMGSGYEANSTIGRSVRLSIRNIGQNTTPFIDTQNRYGRWNDHTLTVIVENDSALPPGWKTHSEMMGYPAGSSTVTLFGFVGFLNWVATESDLWNLQDLLGAIRGNLSTSNSLALSKVILLSPSMAKTIAENTTFSSAYGNLSTKEGLKEFLARSTIGTATRTYSGVCTTWDFTNAGGAARQAGIYANSHIFVTGTDPGYALYMNNIMYGQNLCFTTQLITGSTLTQSGDEATVPSTPENFTVEYSADGQTATLKWDPPLSDGGMPITGYEYNIIHGGNRQTSAWTAVPGGAGAREVTIDLYPTNATTRFNVNNLVDRRNNTWEFFFKVRAANGVVNGAEISTANALTTRTSGKGAWAMILAENTYSVTSLVIATATGEASPSLVTAARNSQLQFGVILNKSASNKGIVWSTSNASLASVDANGLVSVRNTTGTVVLTASDTASGLTHSIVIRIT
jgi:hypothetical protein